MPLFVSNKNETTIYATQPSTTLATAWVMTCNSSLNDSNHYFIIPPEILSRVWKTQIGNSSSMGREQNLVYVFCLEPLYSNVYFTCYKTQRKSTKSIFSSKIMKSLTLILTQKEKKKEMESDRMGGKVKGRKCKRKIQTYNYYKTKMSSQPHPVSEETSKRFEQQLLENTSLIRNINATNNNCFTQLKW